jgi:spermidine/putrescine transport system permease protein
MIPSLPRPAWLRVSTVVYALLFFAFLFLPLVVVAVFAFNDAPYPAPPWRGFTLDWFTGNPAPSAPACSPTVPLLGSLWTSVVVALPGSRCCRCWSVPPTPSCWSAPTSAARRRCRC